MKIKFLLVVALLTVAFAQPARASDPIADVRSASLNGRTVVLNVLLPCTPKWTAYAVTSLTANKVLITVYRRANPKAKCAVKPAQSVLAVNPKLSSGQLNYRVYVNGVYRFTMKDPSPELTPGQNVPPPPAK